MNPYRLFVLLAWAPDLGAYLDPVGVLGVDNTGETCLSWVPMTYEVGRPWRRRLISPISTERIQGWLRAGLVAEAATPETPLPMTEAVEGLLDQVLVSMIPASHTGGR